MSRLALASIVTVAVGATLSAQGTLAPERLLEPLR